MIKIVDFSVKKKYPDIFITHCGVEAENGSRLIDSLIELSKTNKSIQVYDTTRNKKYNTGHMISISDHINLTGTNPIIGNQEKLGIEFIDLHNLYSTKGPEVAFCSQEMFDFSDKYSNHCKHIALLAIAARAVGYSHIEGYLYNI